MALTTFFTDIAAVEAWDRWFRWRDGSGLRDRTIDSTWWRVADAIAAVEGANARLCASRFVDAFTKWRLLPDERLLRLAGTGAVINDHEPLYAMLNVAAFVIAPLSISAHLDLEGIADIAALAVRFLDDALLALPREESAGNAVRVGLSGMAEALYFLGVPYDSPQARQHAREVAIALSNGSLRGAIELARERSAPDGDRDSLVALWRDRETPAALIDDALRWGVRHTRLTAIQSQPRLSQLANNISDALDPLLRAPPLPGSRHSASVAGRREDVAIAKSLVAQVELRAAMQRWIDTGIDYPLATITEPGQDELEEANRLARHHNLPALRVRRADSATRGVEMD
jgi:ribonucleoside-diphosphate reductase alpha chain